MTLPVKTTLDDIVAVCQYLAQKPLGATLREAKAVVAKKHLDGRKLSALQIWGLISESEGKYKLTELGREVVKDNGARRGQTLRSAIRSIAPYHAIIERADLRGEESITSNEVATIWGEHFADQVSDNERTLNDQAICFFHLAQGADLGELIIGRRGAQTRIDFSAEALEGYTYGAAGGGQVDQVKPLESETKQPNLGKPVAFASEGETLGQAIFIAHGKDKKPLDQLKEILDQFKVPYKVAIDEPNLGRPISQKVKEVMQGCNCAVFIFTADEEFSDKEGNVIWRPSENVIYELGAASYLYGNRIVIMKQGEVSFPSDFQDLGYIAFEKGKLQDRAMDILKELIGFEIVKVTT